ncbi:MAG: PQQ-binding-like beta-propeller repeat protein [Gemmatimonadetes bacterium]|nr:PQQ-binding-like beta-propeller repeat protein [Gemmatimonadota bacterium]
MARATVGLGVLTLAACNVVAPIYGGDGKGTFADPRILWFYPQAGAIIASEVDDSSAFFVNRGHQVFAVSKATGAVRWVTTPYNSGYYPGTALLLVGQLVVFPDYELYAFDRRTGALRWVYSDGPTGGPGYTNLASDSTRIFGGSVNGYAYAVDAVTGTLVWKTKIATDTTYTRVSSPAVNSGLVVVTYRRVEGALTGGVAALDAMTGALIWRREFVPAAAIQPSAGYGRAGFWGTLVIIASEDGRVFALDRSSGSDVWVIPRPATLRPYEGEWRPLVIVGDVVVLGSNLASLTGLNAATGAERWKISLTTTGSQLDPMRVAGGTVYLQLGSGQLAALDPVAGRLLWTTNRSNSLLFWTYPAVDSTTLFTAGELGFYALRR